MPARLLADLGGDGQAGVLWWPEGGLPEEVSRAPLAWPLDTNALDDLRWYLEDYLRAPFGVWEDRGPATQAKLAGWGEQVFAAVLGSGPARLRYERARDRGLEVVFRSAVPSLLGLPWELMRDSTGPVALRADGISRSLPVAAGAETLEVPGGRLRVLMLISRPGGISDVGYQMVARPLLGRLAAVRGGVDLTVLRPPTFDMLRQVLRQAAEADEPFHVVHFDGHGVMPGRVGGGAVIGGRQAIMTGPGEGALVFEQSTGGSDQVGASRVAAALAECKVPVVVLNACQSGAVGKELEASVATALLKAGCAAVVAMAYNVYAVAAAEFMAEFYESLFAGESLGQAVTAGRRRLFSHDGRPSPKGDMPLADWLVPVHYMRREVRFPDAHVRRPAGKPSLDAVLDEIRAAPAQDVPTQDPLAAVGAFVGRDDLFYQLEAAARGQRVVVLTGPGGTGKTELAKGYARWWRDTGGVDSPRLVLWHSFEPGVASFGLDGVINEIGLAVLGADFARLEPPQRLDTVKRLLGQLRALLVWDNFESVREMPDPGGATPPLDDDGGVRLRDFLAWVRDDSASMVLITSRAREDWLGEVRRIAVGGLNRAEAAQYAGHLLASFPAAQRRRERRSFGELLEWLDGHPLAMRLTLPRLEADDPAALLAELQGTTLLPPVEDAAQGRLASLGACIAYSFAHLPEHAQRLLPAISLFHGVADENLLMLFSDAEGVPGRFGGISRQEWTAVLQGAAQVGLLTSLGVVGMYQIHPALPGYLAAYWHASDAVGYGAEREGCEQALCSASAALSQWLTGQTESGDAALAYTITGLNRRTLGAMLGYALDRHAWDAANRIVRVLDEYWDTQGLSEEAGAWADRILDATTGHSQNPIQLARFLWLYTTTKQAGRQLDAGQPDQAGQTYRNALAYLQDQPESEWTRASISVVYHQLGATAEVRGSLDEAEDWYRQALTIEEELGNRPHVAAATYQRLGNTARDRGRLDEAGDWYRKSLAMFEELGDRRFMAIIYRQLSVTAERRGRLDEAEDWGRESLTINEELGNRPGMAATYHQLGNTAQDRGRLDEAKDWYSKALTIEEGLGDRPGMAATYHQLGRTAQDRGRLDEAKDWYSKALTIEEGLGDRPGMAATYHELGRTAQDRGRLDEAKDWYSKALTINEEVGNLVGVAQTYGQLGLLAEAQQQPLQALDWTVRCVILFSHFPNLAPGPGPLHMARLTRQLGMPALEEAWQQATGQPVPQVVLDFLASLHDDTRPEGQP